MHLPDNAELAEIGCALCGQACPFTVRTNPPLTRKRAEIWACLHQLVCPAMCHCND